MIQHIKYYFLFLFFIAICCKQRQTNIIVARNNEKETTATHIIHKQEIKKTLVFTFYKSFIFCNTNIGYFTKQQANEIYAEKKISINLDQLNGRNSSNLYSLQDINCLKENLKLDNFNVKLINTSDTFPFDQLKIINDKYVVVDRDGQFFVFLNNKDIGQTKDISKTENKNFQNIFNKKLIGLSVLNKSEKKIFKRYGVDFGSLCMCNSPSFYIDEEKKKLLIFNFCDSFKNLTEIKQKHVLKILKIKREKEQLIISVQNDITFIFQKRNNPELFHLKVLGNIPTTYVGSDLKDVFTSEPEKFEKEKCGDFEG